MTSEPSFWRRCSSCKSEIGFDTPYWVCSVSTCNRKKMPLTFCSVACWDAHLPVMRHRDAWAEERRAPTRAAWEKEQAGTASAPSRPPQRRVIESAAPRISTATDPGPEIQLNDGDLPREILIVASRLKQYIRARSGMKTSEGVLDMLSDMVRKRCDQAIRNAARAERKTVLDRDF